MKIVCGRCGTDGLCRKHLNDSVYVLVEDDWSRKDGFKPKVYAYMEYTELVKCRK